MAATCVAAMAGEGRDPPWSRLSRPPAGSSRNTSLPPAMPVTHGRHPRAWSSGSTPAP